MKPEPNNDIDLLLRQLSRRNGAPVSAPAREMEEQHLDADELNSYVANALPAAARARYTSHLADCSTCRKLVVELSAAQGPVAEQHPAPAIPPSRGFYDECMKADGIQFSLGFMKPRENCTSPFRHSS